jgi:hypothetical protein
MKEKINKQIKATENKLTTKNQKKYTKGSRKN